jgi:hypothetical protein
MKKSILLIAISSLILLSFRFAGNYKLSGTSGTMQSAKLFEPMEFLKVVTFRNKIYVIKPGWCKEFQVHYGSTQANVTDSLPGVVYEFIPEMIALKKIAEMPDTRSFFGADVLNNKLYILGGYDSKWKLSNVVWELNLDTKKWNRKAPLNKKRAQFACEAVNGNIYALYGDGATGQIERMIPDSNRWVVVNPKLSSTNCSQISLVRASEMADNKIYVAAPLGKGFFTYSPFDNTIQELPNTPFQTDQFSSMVVSKRIYFAGGSLPGAFDDKVYMFDIISGTWQTVGKLPAPRCRSAMVSYSSMILFLGGSLTDIGQAPQITDEIYMYRPMR